MSGINRYFEVQSQYRDLHEVFEKRASVDFSKPSTKPPEPCIFLSHRSTDKAAVVEIGKYIMSKDIDVYIDADDQNLQRAVAANDHKAITAAIELGIANSTDLLAFLTPNTASSPWVPYELGFAKREGNHLAAMKSKDLSVLPSYLEIVQQITGIESLANYLHEVLQRDAATIEQRVARLGRVLNLLVESSQSSHPLASYLARK